MEFFIFVAILIWESNEITGQHLSLSGGCFFHDLFWHVLYLDQTIAGILWPANHYLSAPGYLMQPFISLPADHPKDAISIKTSQIFSGPGIF